MFLGPTQSIKARIGGSRLGAQGTIMVASGYNQIKMAKEDAEKTTFRSLIGVFYYTVMPFGLKNAKAIYIRAMMALFHDMFHQMIEFYVDDLVVKFKEKTYHLQDLRKVFDHCRLYKHKMNPLNCAFGVVSKIFLGWVIHC